MAEERINTRSTEETGITAIRVKGFKSLVEAQSIAIKPLTILAGANSSGKSSIMQPLLLMKQTLEAPYDPGVFKLDGPNVVFSSYKEMMPFSIEDEEEWDFLVTCYTGDIYVTFYYGFQDGAFFIRHMEYFDGLTLYNAIEGQLDKEQWITLPGFGTSDEDPVIGFRDRFYLSVSHKGQYPNYRFRFLLSGPFIGCLSIMIHVSGQRKSLVRYYPSPVISHTFPGLFDYYTASAIHVWQKSDVQRFETLNAQLAALELTPKIRAVKMDDTKFEVHVAPKKAQAVGADTPWINIADVGAGVSQVLPVLVAMLAARPGQLVYIEEPELHLHPRAQWRLATIMAETAKRGVRLVIETHSSVLLRGVQTLVAKGELDPELVALHWFTLDPNTGATTVSSAEMDENGAYGDWPEDFDDTALDVEQQYHEAVEKRMFGDG